MFYFTQKHAEQSPTLHSGGGSVLAIRISAWELEILCQSVSLFHFSSSSFLHLLFLRVFSPASHSSKPSWLKGAFFVMDHFAFIK